MQSFIISEKNLAFINLYSLKEDKDDLSLVNLCKTAIDKHFGFITVDGAVVENVWKWIEFKDIKLIGSVNMMHQMLTPVKLFQTIKHILNSGADGVEVIFPPYFFDIDMQKIPQEVCDYLTSISEAKSSKTVKITFESGYIGNIGCLKQIVTLLSQYNIDMVKTSSGFYTSSSTIQHLNAILNQASLQNIGVDFSFDISKSNKFVVDDAFRLAKMLLKQRQNSNNIFLVSYPLELV